MVYYLTGITMHCIPREEINFGINYNLREMKLLKVSDFYKIQNRFLIPLENEILFLTFCY